MKFSAVLFLLIGSVSLASGSWQTKVERILGYKVDGTSITFSVEGNECNKRGTYYMHSDLDFDGVANEMVYKVRLVHQVEIDDATGNAPACDAKTSLENLSYTYELDLNPGAKFKITNPAIDPPVVLTMSKTISVPPVLFLANFQSKYVDGVGRIYLGQTPSGKIRFAHNPAKCGVDEHGREACERIGYEWLTVTPTVIKDRRPSDGPLELRLTDNAVLEVGSGFTQDGTISYAVIFKTKAGKEVRMPLNIGIATHLTP